MKPKLPLHPGATVSAAITRIYKGIHSIERSHEPKGETTSIQPGKRQRPKLRLVK